MSAAAGRVKRDGPGYDALRERQRWESMKKDRRSTTKSVCIVLYISLA